MTNKIYTNKKTLEQVELVSVTEAGRYIVINAEGAQKSYSESSFKKLFKAKTEEPKAEESKTEPKAEPETPKTETPKTEKAKSEEPKAKESSKTNKSSDKSSKTFDNMTAEEQDKILAKIQKLFALAGNNPSQEEACAALAKAQELMAKYSISTLKNNEEYTYVSLPCKHQHNIGIRIPLSQIISKSFRCRVILIDDVIHMFGRKEDARAAVECFNFCYAWIHRSGDKHVAKARQETGTAKGVFHSYAKGVIVGITQSLESGCTALAIIVPQDVKDKFDETYSKCKAVKRGMRNSSSLDYDLYQQGISDGKTLMSKRTISVNL